MTEIPIQLWQNASLAPAEEPLRLRAGPMRLLYQDGFLRDLRVHDCEILRMINFGLRDHNWDTIPFQIAQQSIRFSDTSFAIQFVAVFDQAPIRIDLRCSIEGREDGEVVFGLQGGAASRFRKNRLGFTALHPLRECVGQPLAVTHSDGAVEETSFPQLVSPSQPAFDIAALRWPLPQGGEVELQFEGEVFEMEDQRNWTDASFKTYCTPLAEPFPVELKPGDRIRQTIRLRAKGVPKPGGGEDEGVVSVDRAEASPLAFPSLGIARSSQADGISASQLKRLKALQLGHYRIEVDCSQSGWQEAWQKALLEAEGLELPIELMLTLPGGDSLSALPEDLARGASRVAALTLLQAGRKTTPTELLEKVADMARKLFPRAKIGGGTDGFLAELSRERFDTERVDYLTYCITPQVHAFDERSIIETLEAQPATVATVRGFADGMDIHVSPISLKMRWVPHATEPFPELPPEQLPANVDRRQGTLFAAGFALGSVAQLAQNGASWITLFESLGEKGLMHVERPENADRFPAPPGSVFPVYYLLLELAGARELLPVRCSSPELISALWIRTAEKSKLLLANHTPDQQFVSLPTPFHSAQRRILNAEAVARQARPSAIAWTGTQCQLQPYAIAIFEIERDV